MRIKSYFAVSVADAIAQARRELGPEAMIVSSRKTGPEAMHLGVYEVVMGVQEAAMAPRPDPPALRVEAVESVTKEAAAKVGRFTRIRRSILPTRAESDARILETPSLSEVQWLLQTAGFSPSLTGELLDGIKRHAADLEPLAALREELSSRLQVLPELGRPRAERRIVALVGPPGSGKTSTIVKLAVQHGLRGRRPMHIVALDAGRLGGGQLLRTYSDAMGVSFTALQTANSLSQTLADLPAGCLVFIDTPGYTASEIAGAAPLASLLSRHVEADVHLVLPGCMSPVEMERAAQRYRPFLPLKLIFTHLDEDLVSTGPALAQALGAEMPVSFIGTGQQVPEDLEPASSSRLIDRFVAPMRKAAKESAA